MAGRIRSQRSLVSSSTPDSEILNSTLSIAAPKPAHAGTAYAGLAPWTTSTSTSPCDISAIRRWRSLNEATRP